MATVNLTPQDLQILGLALQALHEKIAQVGASIDSQLRAATPAAASTDVSDKDT